MQRTRIVSIDPEFRRDAAENCRTTLETPPRSVVWSGFEALFRRACGEMRNLCRRFAEPGLAVVACHSGFGVTGKICIASKPEVINTAIVGRHREADLFLSEDPAIALRHLLLIAHRRQGASLFSVLDLRTGSGFLDDEAQQHEAVTCDGPVLVRCGEYALFLLPTAAGAALSSDPATAWRELPPRRLVAASFGLVKAPRPALQLEPAREPPGTFTSLTSRPGPRRAHGELLQPGESPLGTLRLATGHRTASLVLGPTALREGVLLGRYDRCDGAQVFDETASRVHALVLEVDGAPYAIDCASSNQVLVGGEPRRVVPLQPGTSMMLGNTRVEWAALH